MSALQVLSHHDYTIGWVCALSKEQTAATAMLDVIHDDLPNSPTDPNAYTLGSIGKHNIAIACLPEGRYGNNAAATAAAHMVSTFPSLRFGLMVGIGGGIPSNKIRLGDVVVSKPDGSFPGVIQWDLGKVEQGGTIERTGSLNNPPTALLTSLAKLATKREMEGSQIPNHLAAMGEKWPNLAARYTRSEPLRDILFTDDYTHTQGPAADDSVRGTQTCDTETDEEEEEYVKDCEFCDLTQARNRQLRATRIHYGLIASGNMVIKDAQFRNQLNERFGNKILCVEMEAAGLMNDFPCLVIRGICDYADSHKNKAWQKYAAAVAAAFAKELLLVVAVQTVDQMDTITPMLSKITQDLEKVSAYTYKKEDEKILKWLSEFDYGAEHSDVLKRWQPGTGQWLFESVEFKEFIESNDKQVLFCPGIPGAGKTVMAATVIDYLHKHLGNASNIAISYIYFNFNRNNEQTPHAVFLSLLRQIAKQRPTLPKSVRSLYETYEKRNTRPSLEDILETFQEVAKLFSKVFVVIDALDECANIDDCRDIIVPKLMAGTTNFNLKLFTTSRNIPEISKEFESALRLEIRATESDIRRYIDSRLPMLLSSPDTDEGHRFQEEIKTVVCREANGMFLLAQLHLDQLKDCVSEKHITETLKGFRTDSDAYNKAYNAAMGRINQQTPNRKSLAISVLSWITHARRPLSVAELQHALGVEVGEADFDEKAIPLVEKIVSTTAGLVAIDDESDVIRLVHYTTQEFFERTKNTWLPNAENYVAKVCTSYLSCSAFKSGWCHDFEDLKIRIDSFKLYPYSVQNWKHHVNASDFSPSHAAFLAKTPNFHAFIQAFQFLGSGPKIRSPFPVDIQRRNPPKKAANPSGITGLHVAAELGWTETVKILLNDYDDIDIYDHCNRTPFFLAAKSGHLAVMEILLNAGDVDVNVISKPSGYTPLICLALGGHTAAVKMLLDTGKTNIVSKCGRQKTALWYAVIGGHIDVVRLLLDAQSSDKEMIREAHSSALLGAVFKGQKTVVDLILRAGIADMNVQTTYHYGPFHCSYGHNDKYLETVIWERPYDEMESKEFVLLEKFMVAEEFVDTKAIKKRRSYTELDPSSKPVFASKFASMSRWGRRSGYKTQKYPLDEAKSLITLAVERGHESLVKLFLDKIETNLELEAMDRGLNTAMSMAARYGYIDILRLLLDSGKFHLNSRDANGATPLMIAASKGQESIVKLLLQSTTVGIDWCDKDGKTALLSAINNVEELTSVVKLLLDTGNAGVNIKDKEGRAPLDVAFRRGHKNILRLLFNTPGIDLDSEDTHGRKLLSLAIYREKENIFKLCLDTGRFDINAKDHFGLTPLMLATKHWAYRNNPSWLLSQSVILQLLLEADNIDFDARDHKHKRTTLLWAAHAGHLANVKTLVQTGKFNINERDLHGFTCFTLAAQRGRKDVVEYLLNKEGVDLHVKDHKNQRTALMWASYAGKSEIVDLLLKSGKFDINDMDSNGLRPIAIAAQKKKRKIVRILKSYKKEHNEETDESQFVNIEMNEFSKGESDNIYSSSSESDNIYSSSSESDISLGSTSENDTRYSSSSESDISSGSTSENDTRYRGSIIDSSSVYLS